MNTMDMMLRIKCAHVSMEVYLDDEGHYMTGYQAFSDCRPASGEMASGYYHVDLKLHESFLGHKLLITGKDFCRELVLNEVLLHQADASGVIEVDLCEGKLVKALTRPELLLTSSAEEALEYLYDEINNVQETSPAYVNACWQLMMDGSHDHVNALSRIQKVVRSSKIKKNFEAFCEEYYTRFGYPEGYKDEKAAVSEVKRDSSVKEVSESPAKTKTEKVVTKPADPEREGSKPYETTEDGLVLMPNDMRRLNVTEWKYADLLAEVEAEFDDEDWEEELEPVKEVVKEESETKAEAPTSYKTEEELVMIPEDMRRLGNITNKYADILAEVEAEMAEEEDE